jgi:hypothetical protein
MFDATLNGVLDSADAATDLILSDVLDGVAPGARERSAASGCLQSQSMTRSTWRLSKSKT